MASFTPVPAYDISAKTGVERLLTSTSKIWPLGTGMFFVDQAGGMTAAQVFAALDGIVQSRQLPVNSKAVTELTPTTP